MDKSLSESILLLIEASMVDYFLLENSPKENIFFVGLKVCFYLTMFTEPEVNNCFSIIFRAEQRGLQNNGLNIKTQTQLFICIHVCSRSVNNKLSCTSIVNQFTHPVS